MLCDFQEKYNVRRSPISFVDDARALAGPSDRESELSERPPHHRNPIVNPAVS